MFDPNEPISIPTPPPGFKSGFAGVIGRPNVGKSTLTNHLVGQKIAITSPVAQTTRNRLLGILTRPEAQIVLVDTPGIHKPHHQLGRVLVKTARIAMESADAIVFVVDGSQRAGGGDRYIAHLLTKVKIPVVLGLNKIDLQPENATEIEATYGELVRENAWAMVKFSALTGEGVEELLSVVVDRLDPGPYYYPPDLVTDRPERFIMGELIREQIFLRTREEVPHSVAVTIEKVEEQSEMTRVFAAICVERPSQKGIILGKGGQTIKQIGSAARLQIQKLVSGKIYLELFVKVRPKWRQSSLHLAELGYGVEE